MMDAFWMLLATIVGLPIFARLAMVYIRGGS